MEEETYVYGVFDFDHLMCQSWSGAIQQLEQVREKEAEDETLELINDVIGTGITETQLNDYIWFDLDRDLKDYYNINLWDEE